MDWNLQVWIHFRIVQLVDAKCVTCIHIRSLTAVQVYVEGKKFMS